MLHLLQVQNTNSLNNSISWKEGGEKKIGESDFDQLLQSSVAVEDSSNENSERVSSSNGENVVVENEKNDVGSMEHNKEEKKLSDPRKEEDIKSERFIKNDDPVQNRKENQVEIVVDLRKISKELEQNILKKMKSFERGEIDKDQLKQAVVSLLMKHFSVENEGGSKGNNSLQVDSKKTLESVSLVEGKLLLKGTGKLKDWEGVGKEKELEWNDLSVFKDFNFRSPSQENLRPESIEGEKGVAKEVKVETQTLLGQKKQGEKRGKETADFSQSIQERYEAKTELKEGNFIQNNTRITQQFQELQKTFNENKSEIFQQLSKQTKVVLLADQMSFSTFVRPEELGRIDFKFAAKEGRISGKIILQNQEAADLFRANVEELRAVFQRSNVELDKLEIQIAGRGWNGENGFQFSQGGDGKGAQEREGGHFFETRRGELFEENRVVMGMADSIEKGINIVV